MRERYTLRRRGVSLFNETIRHIRISVAPAAANIPPNIWNVAVEDVLVEPACLFNDRLASFKTAA
jgi:hypothetical protein